MKVLPLKRVCQHCRGKGYRHDPISGHTVLCIACAPPKPAA